MSLPEPAFKHPSGTEFNPYPDTDPISLRLDAIDAQIAEMLSGLERMITMLDGFAQRAEPLLNKAEKRGKLFGRME